MIKPKHRNEQCHLQPEHKITYVFEPTILALKNFIIYVLFFMSKYQRLRTPKK